MTSISHHQVMDTWLAYAPVKNNPEDAAKVPKGNPYYSATLGEMAIYRANSLILGKAGVEIADPVIEVFNGQEVEVWPCITWSPGGASHSRISKTRWMQNLLFLRGQPWSSTAGTSSSMASHWTVLLLSML